MEVGVTTLTLIIQSMEMSGIGSRLSYQWMTQENTISISPYMMRKEIMKILSNSH